ncbi:MAG TPA: carboxypeptidase-like regulatory domain-containing protein [Myxococcota bacterium]|nr:carboxypeptidase-like regulatory domain-containing protein [Myxococcota bacterium]HRY95213.1 carboxypeptidase-like regulatory domain-containing protein [Myxococcota bacterium]HSA24597.1 carboxypeptidase-like regulatory domain-containing protein [Myxococcota bacterium]
MRLTALTTCALLGLLTAPAEAGTLSGTVTRTDTGEPVAGAVVVVRGTNLFDQTQADGQFSIAAPAGVFGVSCAAPGLVGASTGALDLGADTARDFGLDPAAGGQIQGTSSCGGAACGGVLVIARQEDRAVAFGLSNAAGAYVIPGLADGSYDLRAIQLGHEVLDVPGLQVTAALPATLDFTLVARPGGYTLSGVVGLSDNPLDKSGSQVSLHGQPGPGTAGTDAGGAYLLPGAPPGLLSVAVRHPGYDPRDQIDVLVRADRALDLALSKPGGSTDPTYRVSGLVRLREPDAPDPTTAAGCRVSLWSDDDRPVPYRQVAQTGADGAYALQGVPPGRYRAGAAREGYLEQLQEAFDLAADRGLDFELQRDPGYDFGPGARDGELGCGAPPGRRTRLGLVLALLALLALRTHRGRSALKRTRSFRPPE